MAAAAPNSTTTATRSPAAAAPNSTPTLSKAVPSTVNDTFVLRGELGEVALIIFSNEIAVLCDAEVALIIFSTKGKLYEYSPDSRSDRGSRSWRRIDCGAMLSLAGGELVAAPCTSRGSEELAEQEQGRPQPEVHVGGEQRGAAGDQPASLLGRCRDLPDFMNVLAITQHRFRFFYAGFFLPQYAHLWQQHMDRLFDLYSSGKLKVAVDPKEFLGLRSVADAVEHLHSGESHGKGDNSIPPMKDERGGWGWGYKGGVKGGLADPCIGSCFSDITVVCGGERKCSLFITSRF
ncbi:hypothetical protein Taro_050551 [Colocasia esculenta]|uniref:MADS-box domain-containing protein n=1 Tax=Colocasia esculenta TaxID=4460 RepID=A0A843XEI3_COLES|nr:hypothetical protein [Colocasia esculenta]